MQENQMWRIGFYHLRSAHYGLSEEHHTQNRSQWQDHRLVTLFPPGLAQDQEHQDPCDPYQEYVYLLDPPERMAWNTKWESIAIGDRSGDHYDPAHNGKSQNDKK
jgi:hypothetical protein